MSVSDDFEASFAEQLEAIQAEHLDERADFDHLPDALKQTQDITPFCFAYPQPDAPDDSPVSILQSLTWDAESRKRAAAIMSDYADIESTRHAHLSGNNDASLLAAARIMAVLVCAEESAINIFHHECGRLDAERATHEQRALREIESEERVHNWLIHQARAYYPAPDDVGSIRRRTRRLFMRVGSRDLATHFARITGLDSGVCISISAILGSKKARTMSGFARLLRHIRHDEASHVKKSRDHAVELGFDANRFHEAYELTRVGMVEMLTPIASSFETLEVDPDRLFGRLLRFQSKRAGSGDVED